MLDKEHVSVCAAIEVILAGLSISKVYILLNCQRDKKL